LLAPRDLSVLKLRFSKPCGFLELRSHLAVLVLWFVEPSHSPGTSLHEPSLAPGPVDPGAERERGIVGGVVAVIVRVLRRAGDKIFTASRPLKMVEQEGRPPGRNNNL